MIQKHAVLLVLNCRRARYPFWWCARGEPFSNDALWMRIHAWALARKNARSRTESCEERMATCRQRQQCSSCPLIKAVPHSAETGSTWVKARNAPPADRRQRSRTVCWISRNQFKDMEWLCQPAKTMSSPVSLVVFLRPAAPLPSTYYLGSRIWVSRSIHQRRWRDQHQSRKVIVQRRTPV